MHVEEDEVQGGAQPQNVGGNNDEEGYGGDEAGYSQGDGGYYEGNYGGNEGYDENQYNSGGYYPPRQWYNDVQGGIADLQNRLNQMNLATTQRFDSIDARQQQQGEQLSWLTNYIWNRDQGSEWGGGSPPGPFQ